MRNHLIDLARVAAMVVVVTFHAVLYCVDVANGQVSVVPWAPGPVVWGLTWALTLLPLFFVTAGYGAAVTCQRHHGQPYAAYLDSRFRKMLGPLTLFLVTFTVASTAASWFIGVDMAVALSSRFAQLLWFMVVYLALTAAAPLLTRWLDARPALTLLTPAATAIAVDALARWRGDWDIHWMNLATVWTLAYCLGAAYQRGWFARLRTRTLWGVVAGCAACLATLVFAFGYPPSVVGFADMLVANLQPPTFAAIPLTLAQTCVLALLDRAGVGQRLPTRFLPVLGVLNALVFSTYLWHIIAIIMADGLLALVALLLPATAPVATSLPLCALVTWAMAAWLIPLLARAESRLIPPAPQRAGGGVVVGFAALVVGMWLVWQFGAVVHPRSPLGVAAVAVTLAGLYSSRHAGLAHRTAHAD
ncbi:MAG: acyltransferase [Propionibacteriaceae bacterium]|jgi:surface polysaccharide O-acyltransferase-like enzyme|nr:acyltransferase [Propionibacteriaceae bacterium]